MEMSLLFLFLLPIALVSAKNIQVGFYNSSCPQAESIVQAVVQKHFDTDPSIAPALLRMYFHDCFVRGCDASILIDPIENVTTEKSFERTVRGYEIIDEAKLNLEARCPSTVSCADIIALATRDAVALVGGLGYDVPTGRRDGLRSNIDDVNLPGAMSPIEEARQLFTSKGLTVKDMVVLLGAHTIGAAHCNFIRIRLFDTVRTGRPIGPAMDPILRNKVLQLCGGNPMPFDQDPTIFLDQNTSLAIDNSFYNEILESRGVLLFDQLLAFDDLTRKIVEHLASDKDEFMKQFADALVKLGNVEVLVGNEGEIRKNCRVFNKQY